MMCVCLKMFFFPSLQVVLCDFDAAIELDSNDCIPASSSSQVSPHMLSVSSRKLVFLS